MELTLLDYIVFFLFVGGVTAFGCSFFFRSRRGVPHGAKTQCRDSRGGWPGRYCVDEFLGTPAYLPDHCAGYDGYIPDGLCAYEINKITIYETENKPFAGVAVRHSFG